MPRPRSGLQDVACPGDRCRRMSARLAMNTLEEHCLRLVRRLSVLRVPEGFDVCKILGSARGPFVAQERLSSDEGDGLGSQSTELAACPHFVPGHATNLAHHMNLDWLDAHFDDLAARDDVGRGQRRGWKSEIGHREQNAAAIVFGGTHEDVEVARESWRAVERQRMRADDHKLNRVRGQ